MARLPPLSIVRTCSGVRGVGGEAVTFQAEVLVVNWKLAALDVGP